MNFWLIFWVSLFIFLFILSIVIGFIVYTLRVYRYKIRLYRNIGNGWQEFKFYRARELTIKDSLGERVLWVPKAKRYVSSYGEMMGKNMYYYAQGQDGYWYNIKLGDIDAKMGMLDIEVVNRDVRAFHVTNAKRIQQRYDKPKQWPMVVMAISVILALIIVFGGGYFLYGQVGKITDANAGALQVAKETSSANLKVAESIDETTTRLTAIANALGEDIKEGSTGIEKG